MIDIMAERKTYRAREIYQVGLVSNVHNPEDGLTKFNESEALKDLMVTG